MSFNSWARSNIEYSRRVLGSGLEGARSGREAFLNGKSLSLFLSESVCHSWKPAAIGTCVGVLCGFRGNRDNTTRRVVTCGFLGSAVGFAAGVAWKNRHLVASVAEEAVRKIDTARDEHWLEQHPIDYA